MARESWRGSSMNKKEILVCVFFILLLLSPLVFGQSYKVAQQIEIPSCYGNVEFRIHGTYAPDDIRMEGCLNTTYCDCSNSSQIINFSVLDNISNTFEIIGQYYLLPPDTFYTEPNQVYVLNEDNVRYLRFPNVKSTIGMAGEQKSEGVPVDMTKILLIIFIIFAVIGIGVFVAIKLMGSKDKKAITKPKIEKQEQTKSKVDNTDDVKDYLKELEDERRK
jgi:hypothetical protein